MNLNEQEYQQFLDANHSLILYAGKSKKLLNQSLNLTDFRIKITKELAVNCADAFYENPNMLVSFLKENPDQLSPDSLAVAKEFKHFVKGSFFVYKYLKDYTIFIKDEKLYGVYGLSDPFYHFFGKHLPTYVDTVLLPYKDKITFYGILKGGSIRLGSGYKRSLNQVYKEAKAKYGIITSLPHGGNTLYDNKTPSEQLAYFLKTKANREEFDKEILALVKQYPELAPQYHQIWGKIFATDYKKEFKPLGLNKAYYATLQGHLISSAKTLKELKKNIDHIVPAAKKDWVYTFKM